MMKKKKNDANQAGNQSKPTQNTSKQAGNKKDNLKLTVGDDKKRKKEKK